jgi:hypothetical protein
MRTPGQAIAENAGQGILRLRKPLCFAEWLLRSGRQIQNQITITTIKIKGKRTRESAPHELVKRKRAGFHHLYYDDFAIMRKAGVCRTLDIEDKRSTL